MKTVVFFFVIDFSFGEIIVIRLIDCWIFSKKRGHSRIQIKQTVNDESGQVISAKEYLPNNLISDAIVEGLV